MFWSQRKPFANKHVCITGGSEGLGLCLAQRFVDEGSNVTIISRSETKLEAAAHALKDHVRAEDGLSKVTWRAADISDTPSLEKALSSAKEELGPVDVLVCNAGFALPGRFLDMEMDVFKSQVDVNYLGTVATVKLVAPDMVERKSGDIVLVSSALGTLGMCGYTSYSPTKWAIRGFADCLRMELQAHGVGVYISCPPAMDTPGHEKDVNPPEVEAMKRAVKLQLFTADETADCIMSGLRKKQYHLPTPDFLQSISQSTMSSLSPHPYWTPLQMLVSCLSVPVKYYLTRMFDRVVRETLYHEKK